MVHTIGTLFEKSGYKSALKDGNVPRFVSDVAAGVAGSARGANPLEREEKKREGSYEVLNRDTGACVVALFIPCAAFVPCVRSCPSSILREPSCMIELNTGWGWQRCACARLSWIRHRPSRWTDLVRSSTSPRRTVRGLSSLPGTSRLNVKRSPCSRR